MSRPQSEVRAELVEAVARVQEALQRFTTAWRRLHEQQPGWPTESEGGSGETSTQPERLGLEVVDAEGHSHPSQLDRDDRLRDLDTLDREAKRIFRSAAAVYDVCVSYGTPTAPKRTNNERLAGVDISAAGWCRSCYRDNSYLEPIHVNKHGERVYRDFCRWCGDWQREHSSIPPLPIIKARHSGQRITEQLVEKYLKRGA